jgi:benzoate membrane transport protein
MTESDKGQDRLAPVGIALRTIILFIAVITVPLTAAEELGLSAGETIGWILATYGLSGLLSLALAIFYRQPLLTTGNLFALIFVVSVSQTFSYPELIGAFIVAGAAVLVLSALGVTERLAALLPAPIVFGLLTGAVIPFVWRIFTTLGDAPLLVGGTLAAYLLGRRFLNERVPAILPALLTGIFIAGVTGQFGPIPGSLLLPVPEITTPNFSLQAILTVSPVLVILITLQANLPSLVFMQDQGYKPPQQIVDTTSGVGTVVGSFLGPTGISLSLPVTSLVAGPEAGEKQVRHRSVYLAAGGLVLIGLLAGYAAEIPAIIPSALLVTLAGLALFNVLINAIQEVAQGPLLLGPVFALVISLSDISLLGFGPFFWALTVGSAVSLLLERDALQQLQEQARS